MKFSVLLPTRNRLEYLRYAVETVRRQDYADWEIIVSDNDSEDDIAGYVASLDDPRIRYFRTRSFVPVTENWNYALARSTGDYVVMLGDDDGLLPSYFSRLVDAMADHPDPDFVYAGALFYAYPGVMPDAPEGFLRGDRNRVFGGSEPFWLDRERAVQIARGYLDFRMPVASNMQFSLISRRMIDRLSSDDGFFQSPYPDFYATPALFLIAERILIFPDPLVVIGITPKSYGYFHFNNKASHGVEFLNNSKAISGADHRTLPGTSYNDSWLLAMDALNDNFSGALGLSPNYRRYRLLQIIHSFKRCYFDGSIDRKYLKPLLQRMTWSERWLLGPALRVGFGALAHVPRRLRDRAIARLRRAIGQHAMADRQAPDEKFGTLIDVYDYAARHRFRAHEAAAQ